MTPTIDVVALNTSSIISTLYIPEDDLGLNYSSIYNDEYTSSLGASFGPVKFVRRIEEKKVKNKMGSED